MKKLWVDFIAMIFPNYCLTCQQGLWKGEQLICTKCIAHLPKTQSHIQSIEVLSQKFWGKVPLIQTLAYLKFTKQGIVQKLLHNLKYNNRPDIGETLGKWYGADLREKDLNQRIDIIIPVPLHPVKQKKRGYNQSEAFARGLAHTLEVDWTNKVLLRKTNTDTQTKKNRIERWENVNKVFTVSNQTLIKDKYVLLVDDVVTTGATLEAASKVLLNHQAKGVSVATIAYA